MSTSSPDCTALVSQASAAMQHGDLPVARRLLAQALHADPRCVRAWILLAAAVHSPAQRRECLERALALDPSLEWVRQVLVELPIAAAAEPPVAEPPVAEPPVADPLAAEPPVAEPLAAEPPVVAPPVSPAAAPPAAAPQISASPPPVAQPSPATEAQPGRPARRRRTPAAVNWIVGLGLAAGLLWLGLSYVLFLILYWLDDAGRVSPLIGNGIVVLNVVLSLRALVALVGFQQRDAAAARDLKRLMLASVAWAAVLVLFIRSWFLLLPAPISIVEWALVVGYGAAWCGPERPETRARRVWSCAGLVVAGLLALAVIGGLIANPPNLPAAEPSGQPVLGDFSRTTGTPAAGPAAPGD